MTNQKNEKEVKVDVIRQRLKELMSREIEKLPELLEQLPPEQRINVVFKMIPFFIPKVDKVSSSIGDPFGFGVD